MTISTESPNEDLPADEGHQAFRDRKTLNDNPYQEDDLRYSEFHFRIIDDMAVMTELQKDFHNANARTGNVLRSLPWAIGMWVSLTTLFVGVQLIGAIFSPNWVLGNEVELREAFNFFVTISASVSAIAVLGVGLPMRLLDLSD
jgi:hypothetical protein